MLRRFSISFAIFFHGTGLSPRGTLPACHDGAASIDEQSVFHCPIPTTTWLPTFLYFLFPFSVGDPCARRSTTVKNTCGFQTNWLESPSVRSSLPFVWPVFCSSLYRDVSRALFLSFAAMSFLPLRLMAPGCPLVLPVTQTVFADHQTDARHR